MSDDPTDVWDSTGVDYGDHAGKRSDSTQWGGYLDSGVLDADGHYHSDGRGGQQDDVARYQGMGEAAAARQAYALDWSGSMQQQANSSKMHDQQAEATRLSRDAARGQDWQSYNVGQNALHRGYQNQQAAAMSARGGGLAQAAAMQQQHEGGGAYLQSGGQQLEAQRAQEMAAARQQYMDSAQGMRRQDQQQQGIYEQRAQAEQRTALAQRQLNDQAQSGYERMGNDVNNAALGANLHQRGLAVHGQQAMEAEHQAQNTHDQARINGIISTIPIFGAQASQGSALAQSPIKSDETTKQQVVPLYSGLGEAAVSRTSGPKAKPKRGDSMGSALEQGLAPYQYEYKPEYRGAQAEGEKNVGPMAQNMASNPITASAVKMGSDGKMELDHAKTTKLNSAGIGYLAAKQRELEEKVQELSGPRHDRHRLLELLENPTDDVPAGRSGMSDEQQDVNLDPDDDMQALRAPTGRVMARRG